MIDTERLLLRRWHEADASAHHAMCADPEVSRYLGPPPTLAQSAEVVARQNRIADHYGSCFWAVERRAGGRFIGWCGVKPGPAGSPIAGAPEIGWSLARDWWGQGMAIEAARAALAFFWLLRPPEPWVAAITTPANLRSQAVMTRLGMSRVAGGDFDHPALAEDDPLRRHILYQIDRA